MERTLVLFKPDCLRRRLVGRMITRLEDKGYDIIAMKMMQVTPELAKRHYAEHVAKSWYPDLEAFITAAPLIAAIVEGPQAIGVLREMVGATHGLKAAPGTIRGDYGTSRQMNLIHAADGPEAATREIDLFFDDAEIHPYQPTIRSWLRAADEG